MVEFIRYFIASLLALVLDVALLMLGVEALGLHYLLAAAVGFLAGNGVVYGLSIRWVFHQRRLAGRAGEEFTAFVLIGVAGLGLNLLVLWGLTDGLGAHYLLSKGVAVGLSFLFNFLLRQGLLFRVRKHVNGD